MAKIIEEGKVPGFTPLLIIVAIGCGVAAFGFRHFFHSETETAPSRLAVVDRIDYTSSQELDGQGRPAGASGSAGSGANTIAVKGASWPPGVDATGWKPLMLSNGDLSSGLKYQDLKVGTGAEPEKGDNIRVHYTGYFPESKKKFDSSLDRHEPFTFQLGVGQVIRGWDEGFRGMKVGGKRKLIIPADLAYGQRGMPPMIPPNSWLGFDVELLGIDKAN